MTETGSMSVSGPSFVGKMQKITHLSDTSGLTASTSDKSTCDVRESLS